MAALSCLETIHSLTLEHFETSGSQNERLWLKINIKLAKLLLSRKDYAKLGAVLQRLHKVVELPDGSDDPNKGTYAIEIFALEILMLTEIKDIVRLRVSKVILGDYFAFLTINGFLTTTTRAGYLSTRIACAIGHSPPQRHGHNP